MLNALPEVATLVDLDAAFAARQSALEDRRRVVSWAKDYVEEVIGLGFAVDLHLDGGDLVIRIGAVLDGPVGPAGVAVTAPIPQEFSDPADLAPGPVAAPVAAETPAEEAGEPPGDRADGGGVVGSAAPVETAGRAAPWTAEEDALLVNEVARLYAAGATFDKAYGVVSAMLPGRTVLAIRFRALGHLKDRINAALAERPVVPAPAPATLPESVAPSVPADLPRWQRDLGQRLDELNARNPQPVSVDLAIAEGKAKGIGTTVIAARTGLTVTAILHRYHRLMPVKTTDASEKLLIELRRRAALAQGEAA